MSNPPTSSDSATRRPSSRPARGRGPAAPKSARPARPLGAERAEESPPSSPSPSPLHAPAADLAAQRALLADPAVILAGGRAALEDASSPPTPASPAAAVDATPETSPQWQRRALVSATPPLGAPAAPSAAATSPPAAVSLTERALAAELREARATLAIARETAQLQREEIRRLRQQHAATTASPPASNSDATAPALERLARRVQTLEAELDLRERERKGLLETFAAHERERAEHARQIDALNDRLEVQAEALDRTRRELDQERRRHTEAQTLLARLRSALHGVDGPPAEVAAAPLRRPVSEPVAAPRPEPAPAPRPAIFDAWRESQIQRHFGAVGIDCTADLLRDPLARRAAAPSHRTQTILLLGPSSQRAARALVDVLLRGNTPRFVLLVADPVASGPACAREEDLLADVLKAVDCPASPSALANLIRTVEPDVIVSRDFLTGRDEPAAWLEVLAAAQLTTQSCLAFLEETGQAAAPLTPEIEAIGERIWALLPERYTRDPASDRAIGSFREAHAMRRCTTGPPLVDALRDRFELELFAQFGLLAEVFVAGPIAGCFDPASARDRRFLDQIAALDERRLEAGAGPALHLVARVDPLADR